jgi:uncharacterized protein with GYD domain
MGKYLFQARYTSEGTKGLSADGGTKRREVVEKACAAVGGKCESFYFAFGDVDAYVVCDLPDATAATALALAVNQSGKASVTTTVLMTCEEVDQAAKTVAKVTYRPPGG